MRNNVLKRLNIKSVISKKRTAHIFLKELSSKRNVGEGLCIYVMRASIFFKKFKDWIEKNILPFFLYEIRRR